MNRVAFVYSRRVLLRPVIMSSKSKSVNTRTRSGRSKSGDQPEKPDEKKTLNEWLQLSSEALKLRINAKHLKPKTKKKLDLCTCLFRHYHPDGNDRRRQPRKGDNTSAQNSSDDLQDPDDILNDPPPEIFRAEDEPEEEATLPYDGQTIKPTDKQPAKIQQANKQPANKQSVRQSTPPPESDSDGDTQKINLSVYIDKAVKSAVGTAVGTAVADAMKPVLEELSVFHQKVNLAEAESRALRSHIDSAKSGTDFTVHSNFKPNGGDPAVTSSSDQITSGSASSSSASGILPGGNAPNPIIPQKNPFSLPALLKKHLEIIERGEYLDFDKIKPKKLDQRKREDEGEGFGVAMTSQFDYDLGEETLRLRKVSTNRVESFSEWLQCWNKFFSACLHYHPELQAALLAYQRLLTSFALRYKFSAIYQYDIDFRKLIAAERSLPHAHRTAMWDRQHDELKNEHLSSDHLIPPKTCFKCNEKGHIATNCNKNISGNRNRHGKQNNQRFQSHPPPPGPPPTPPQVFGQPQPFQFQSPSFYPTHFQQPGPLGPPHSTYNPNKSWKPCNTWNQSGNCYRGPACNFQHQCNKCGRYDHGGTDCKNHQQQQQQQLHQQPDANSTTTTSYRPRF